MTHFYEAEAVQKSFRLEVIKDSDLEKIHNSALQILANTGIAIGDEKTRTLLADGGATLCENEIVKIPASLVESSLKTLPSQVYLHGRGNQGFHLGDGKVRFTSFGESPQIIDAWDGSLRNVTLKDVKSYACLVDALPSYDMCWDAWVPSELPPETYNLHTLKAYLENTTKPVCSAATNGIVASAVVKIMETIAGGKEALKQNPPGIAGTCPKSPLNLDRGTCEATVTLAQGGVPVMNMSALTAGGTGPVTLAGTMAVHHAEMLTCIVITQLAAPGSACIYGACTTALDLRKGTSAYGCPEFGMLSAGLSRLCQKYNIPHVVAGFWTDSKASDLQCGHEKTLDGMLPALAGADMIFGMSGLAAGMSGSFAQLVVDGEMVADIRRVLEGIPVEDDDIALDVIDHVGPKGQYLSEMHTMTNMRRCQIYPELADRSMTHEWIATGSKTMADKAKEKAEQLLASHKAEALDQDIKTKIADTIAEAERELGIS